MRLIWTKSNMVLSRLIRWGLDTDCSHFAIVFNSPAGGLMFESNLIGTHPSFYKNSSKKFELVHSIDLNIPAELENMVWDKIVDKYDGKGYDFGAFAYFIWRGILKKFLNISMPDKNRWATENAFLCVECGNVLEEFGIVLPLGIDTAIASPHEVYLKICEKLNLP